MNDSGGSLGIHITCRSREREKVIKRWSVSGTWAWCCCVFVHVRACLCVCPRWGKTQWFRVVGPFDWLDHGWWSGKPRLDSSWHGLLSVQCTSQSRTCVCVRSNGTSVSRHAWVLLWFALAYDKSPINNSWRPVVACTLFGHHVAGFRSRCDGKTFCEVLRGDAAHLQLLLPLQGELLEGLDDDAGVGAVVDKDGRAAHPRLQVVDGQRDVLSVVLREERQTGGRETQEMTETHCQQLTLGLIINRLEVWQRGERSADGRSKRKKKKRRYR